MRLSHTLPTLLLLLSLSAAYAGPSQDAQVAVVELLESQGLELQGCRTCGPRVAVCSDYEGSIEEARQRMNAAFAQSPQFDVVSEWREHPTASRRWGFGDNGHPIELEILKKPNRVRVSVALDPLPERSPLREPPLKADEPGVSQPRLIGESRYGPCYPDRAREVRLTANVILGLVIDTDGHTRDVEVLRCTRPGVGFEEAAAEVVRHWRYEPLTHMGRPISLEHVVQISFELR